VESTLHTSHPYIITSTKCRINTVVSPDDGLTVARNMYRTEINILRKIVHQVGNIYKSPTKCDLETSTVNRSVPRGLSSLE